MMSMKNSRRGDHVHTAQTVELNYLMREHQTHRPNRHEARVRQGNATCVRYNPQDGVTGAKQNKEYAQHVLRHRDRPSGHRIMSITYGMDLDKRPWPL